MDDAAASIPFTVLSTNLHSYACCTCYHLRVNVTFQISTFSQRCCRRFRYSGLLHRYQSARRNIEGGMNLLYVNVHAISVMIVNITFGNIVLSLLSLCCCEFVPVIQYNTFYISFFNILQNRFVWPYLVTTTYTKHWRQCACLTVLEEQFGIVTDKQYHCCFGLWMTPGSQPLFRNLGGGG